MIVRLDLINRHVDLSHITSVGEAQFFDHMGSGGWFVGFTIDFILQDQPRLYQWSAEDCGGVEYRPSVGHMAEYEDGTWSNNVNLKDHGSLVCINNLNSRILRDIVKPWQDWKEKTA